MVTFAWISLCLALLCALIVMFDEMRRPQSMAIMNVVWPVTCLYFSVFALWAYFVRGRATLKPEQMPMDTGDHEASQPISLWQVALAGSHCGAGCALADIVSEFGVFGLGLTIAGRALYASFLWDFLLAWTVGVVFQYLTIKPMRHLSVGNGIVAAIKADTLSILAFQVGMYGWMAVAGRSLHLEPTSPVYWLSMQGAMILGYATSLPMNWLLLRLGWKERMS